MFRTAIAFAAGVAALGAMLPAAGPAARAADYPTRPVTLVVAFPPGGPSDVLARIIGKKLEQILGQPFVIENRPGAGGNVAAEQVARAAAGRLHAAQRQQQHPRHQCRALQEDQFRSAGRFRADQPDRLAGQHPGGEPGREGELDGRADRARQGQSGQDQLRFLRLRRGGASRRRVVQGRRQDRHRARALQGRGAGAAGRDRRPCADDVRDLRLRRRPHPQRQGAAAGGDHAQAHGAAAGAADHR